MSSGHKLAERYIIIPTNEIQGAIHSPPSYELPNKLSLLLF